MFSHRNKGNTDNSYFCKLNFWWDWQKPAFLLCVRIKGVDSHNVFGYCLPNFQSLIVGAEDTDMSVVVCIVVVVVVAVVVVLKVFHMPVGAGSSSLAKFSQLRYKMLLYSCARHRRFVGLKAFGFSTFYSVFAVLFVSFKAILSVHCLMTQRAFKCLTTPPLLHLPHSASALTWALVVMKDSASGARSHERFWILSPVGLILDFTSQLFATNVSQCPSWIKRKRELISYKMRQKLMTERT